jgi:sulfite reductase alpha subunit-like flavoprotein
MRAMIEERSMQKARSDILVFGNRNREKDYLFEEEWVRFHQSDNLNVLTAFSRDGPVEEKKTYVQDVITKEAQQICDLLIRKNGMLFISGSSGKMPQGVKEAIIEVIKSEQGVERERAQEIQASIEQEGRWKQETW